MLPKKKENKKERQKKRKSCQAEPEDSLIQINETLKSEEKSSK